MMLLKVRIVAALAASLLLGASAMAQTAATAPTDGPVSSAPQTALDAQIAAYLNAPSQVGPVKDGPGLASPLEEAPPDRAVHGEIGAGIGSGGYREVHGAIVAPVGSGSVAVAFSQVRGRGYLGPADDGAFALAGALDGAAPVEAPGRTGVGAGANLAAATQPANCAPAAGKSGSEPLWITRLRAAHPADTDVGCPIGQARR